MIVDSLYIPAGEYATGLMFRTRLVGALGLGGAAAADDDDNAPVATCMCVCMCR